MLNQALDIGQKVQFIQAVAARPHLYDLMAREYNNPRKRDESWAQLGSLFGLPKPFAYFRNIKDAYVRERKKLAISRATAGGGSNDAADGASNDGGEAVKSGWPLFDTMRFLDECLDRKNRTSGDIQHANKTPPPRTIGVENGTALQVQVALPAWPVDAGQEDDEPPPARRSLKRPRHRGRSDSDFATNSGTPHTDSPAASPAEYKPFPREDIVFIPSAHNHPTEVAHNHPTEAHNHPHNRSTTTAISTTEESPDCAGEDEFEVFSRYLVAKLRKIADREQCSALQLHIMQLVHEARFGR